MYCRAEATEEVPVGFVHTYTELPLSRTTQEERRIGLNVREINKQVGTPVYCVHISHSANQPVGEMCLNWTLLFIRISKGQATVTHIYVTHWGVQTHRRT